MTPPRSGPPGETRDLSRVAGDGEAGPNRRRDQDLRRAWAVARWTDARFLDPLIGLLLPGLGDVAGAAAGLYIVAIAVRHGVPRPTVARMLLNISVDCVGGVVPVLGDFFDLLNRANLRNARLLQQHFAGAGDAPAAATLSGRSLAFSVAMLVLAVAVALGVAYAAVRHWWR